jgi:hypothetical protein
MRKPFNDGKVFFNVTQEDKDHRLPLLQKERALWLTVKLKGWMSY